MTPKPSPTKMPEMPNVHGEGLIITTNALKIFSALATVATISAEKAWVSD